MLLSSPAKGFDALASSSFLSFRIIPVEGVQKFSTDMDTLREHWWGYVDVRLAYFVSG